MAPGFFCCLHHTAVSPGAYTAGMNLRPLLTCALALASSAAAVTLSGTVEGKAAPGTRIGAWAVTAFGQPVQELGSAPVNGGKFSLTLPDQAPPPRALVPVDEHLNWPGLLEFQKASGDAQAAELKFFMYRDDNGSGTRQDGESLREVRLEAGRGELFVVWASAPVTVTGSRDYRADLTRGWNTLVVEVRSNVSVKPYDSKLPLTITLGQ